jgi:hypothetical protein
MVSFRYPRYLYRFLRSAIIGWFCAGYLRDIISGVKEQGWSSAWRINELLVPEQGRANHNMVPKALLA